MKFTARSIESLKDATPEQGRYEVWEDNGGGLGLRVSKTGRKTWIMLYRFDGRPRRLTLGTFGNGSEQLSLAKAHKAHADAMAELEQSRDPGDKAVTQRREARKAPTVAELADEYIERYAKPKKRSWAEDRRILDFDVLPAWKGRKAASIRRRDVIDLLDSIVDRGAGIQANRTLACVRKMFNFAVERDIVTGSPVIGIKAPASENRRDRVLNPNEVRQLLTVLMNGHGDRPEDQLSMSRGIRLALRLQLLTGQRKQEVTGAEWANFDLPGRIWTIPGEKAKNGRPHRVPLSPQALEVIEEVRALSEGNAHLFPARHGPGPITAESINRAVYRDADIIGIAKWTPHDLRRTAATLMSENGTQRLVIAKVLNHVSVDNTVTAVYDRHSYDLEKRQALEGLGRRVAAIIDGEESNVAFLAQR